MFKLNRKCAIVTGATGGIGNAIAKKLHQAGATVVISGTRESVLKELAAELKERVHVLPCNLKDDKEVQSLVATAIELMGGLDIIVCNAGVTRDNLAIRMSLEEFDDVVNINLRSTWILNRDALKVMSKNRVGRIINIASIVGQMGNFGQTNYAASKAGIIGMTKSFALEGAMRNITANCIAPGFIETPMTSVLKDEIKEKILTKIPLGCMGSPDDIAAAALYLASDEAKYVTGHVMQVNGGMYM